MKAADEPDARRCALLDAAVAVFMRFGYRKTSMDQVARAAGISRQGLYLHFANKEELFCAAVVHVYERALADALASLADKSRSLEEQLTGAFDAWTGPYVGASTPANADLGEAAEALVGPLVAEREAELVEALTKLVRRSGLVSAYSPVRITARELAETLHATARGLKTACASRAEFGRRIGIAVRAITAPLARSS